MFEIGYRKEKLLFRYLILVLETVLMPTTILAIMTFYNRKIKNDEKVGKEIYLALLISCIQGAVVAYLREYTNYLSKAWYSIYLLSIEIPVLLLIMLYVIVSLFRKNKFKYEDKIGSAVLTIYVYLLNAYISPTLFLFMINFAKGETGILSTAVLFKFIGFSIGFLLMLLFYSGIYKMANKHSVVSFKIKSLLIMLVVISVQIFALIQPLFARRIIPFNITLFKVLNFFINQSYVFRFAVMLLALLIPVSVWYKSFFINQPYSNPAEHRKIRADARRRRRWSETLILVLAFSLVTLTAIKEYDEREVVLSPVEDSVVEDGYIYIPVENVDDGKLHRFHHMAENGKIEVRFIVIKKNEHAYGIGLDACEICGSTGYYQRNENVVCKRCDVVMNIQTIGFKGGCNPIPFDYEVVDGRIKIKQETLENLKGEFR